MANQLTEETMTPPPPAVAAVAAVVADGPSAPLRSRHSTNAPSGRSRSGTSP